MIFDPITLIGIAGAVLILVAFILEQTNVWKNDWLRYDLVNFIGGALLVWYGMLIKGYPFVVLNGIWAFVSLKDFVSDFLRMKKHD